MRKATNSALTIILKNHLAHTTPLHHGTINPVNLMPDKLPFAALHASNIDDEVYFLSAFFCCAGGFEELDFERGVAVREADYWAEDDGRLVGLEGFAREGDVVGFYACC